MYYHHRKETPVIKRFVEIDDATYKALSIVAKSKGFATVEELLTAFAKNFSTGCSVTLKKTEAA